MLEWTMTWAPALSVGLLTVIALMLMYVSAALIAIHQAQRDVVARLECIEEGLGVPAIRVSVANGGGLTIGQLLAHLAASISDDHSPAKITIADKLQRIEDAIQNLPRL